MTKSYEELIRHFETYRNKIVELIKDMPPKHQENWIDWLAYEIKKELGVI